MMRRVIVTIDELCLHGLDVRDGSTIGDALAAKLTEFFREQHTPQRVRSLERIDGGSFAVGPGASASTVGKAIGSAIGRGLQKPC